MPKSKRPSSWPAKLLNPHPRRWTGMSTLTAPATAAAEHTLAYAQALNEALREEMARDRTVLVMGEDIGEHGGIYTVTRGLIHEFGRERVIDTPISEGAIMGGAM